MTKTETIRVGRRLFDHLYLDGESQHLKHLNVVKETKGYVFVEDTPEARKELWEQADYYADPGVTQTFGQYVGAIRLRDKMADLLAEPDPQTGLTDLETLAVIENYEWEPKTFRNVEEAKDYCRSAAKATGRLWTVSEHDLSRPEYTIGKQLLGTNQMTYVVSDMDTGMGIVARVEGDEE